MSMEKIIKFYKDAELTEEISDATLRLGSGEYMLHPVGEEQDYKFWVLNDSDYRLITLDFIFDHQEIKLVEAPKELLPHANSEFIIKFNSDINLEENIDIPIRIKGIRFKD